MHYTPSHTSSETQGRLVGARGNKSSKEMKRRRFTMPDLFPLAPTNRPWVSEDASHTNVSKFFNFQLTFSQLILHLKC